MLSGRFEMSVSVQDCYFPTVSDTSTLRFQVTIASQTQEIRLPSASLLFSPLSLHPNDSIQLRVLGPSQDLGHAEIVLREQFPVQLSGEFDMWFKLTDPLSFVSPERERPFDSSPQRRIGRVRLKVTLSEKAFEPVFDPPDLPEGLENCPRCGYLEKVLASLELEMEGRAEVVRWQEEVEERRMEGTEETVGETPTGSPKMMTAEEVEIEHLKMVIVALNQKLSSLQADKSDFESLRSQLSEALQSKSLLQKTSEETIAQFKTQLDSLSDTLRQAQDDSASNRAASQSIISELRDLQLRNNQLVGQALVMSGQLEGYKARSQSTTSLISQNEELIKRLEQEEMEAESHRLNLQRISQDYQGKTAEWIKEIEARGSELTRIRGENEELRHTIHILKGEIDRLKADNLALKTRVASVQNERDSLSIQLASLSRSGEDPASARKAAADLQVELAKMNEIYQTKVDEFAKATGKMQQEASKARALMGESETALKKMHAVNESLLRENNALKVQFAEQKHALAQLNDERNAWKASTNRSRQNVESVSRLRHDVDYLADSLLRAGERSLEANRLIPRLKYQLDERDAEVEVLRGMVSDYQRGKPEYVPVKDDPVDAAVASYVNEKGHLPVSFCRQDEGLYLFGTKRVFIKLENGNIVIRVGGGYMRVEEFVEIYTPLELGKLAQTHEKQRLLRSGLLTRLASSSHLERREGRLEISPQRASKLLKEFLERGGEKFSTCFAVQRRSNSPAKTLKHLSSFPETRNSTGRISE